MPKKNVEKKEAAGSPAWMTTFSDLMSLLLTFFILLYSMSTLDAIKFKSVASALQSVLLGEAKPTIFQHDITGETAVDPVAEMPSEDQIEAQMAEMLEKVKAFVKNNDLEAEVSVMQNKRGIVLEINEKVVFEMGEAILKEDSKDTLDKISLLFLEIDNDVIIEGHTDNIPINTPKYPSNWELSSSRSVNVLRYFLGTESIIPERISATGYGEYRPVVENSSRENRAKNRRVNILILINEELY